MDNEQQQLPDVNEHPLFAPPPPPPAPNDGRHVKLQPFWPHSPDAGFRLAEAQFRLCHADAQQVMFDLVLGALPEVSV